MYLITSLIIKEIGAASALESFLIFMVIHEYVGCCKVTVSAPRKGPNDQNYCRDAAFPSSVAVAADHIPSASTGRGGPAARSSTET